MSEDCHDTNNDEAMQVYGAYVQRQLRRSLDELAEREERIKEHLSPYQHELNGQGTDCAEDCPACRWVCDKQLSQIDMEPDITWCEKLYALDSKGSL
jgi:hypothetical protein